MKCDFCDREMEMPCRSTRCMEDNREDRKCFDALMRAGGGEYTVNQLEADRREAFMQNMHTS